MRLKRVRVFGFKTFADKAEFDIDGGIVAVVGPNGCGKSNLVDAILWGLGEGSAKHLRAQSSQDVIFGGSAKRKPLGFAEVTLLFDNEDGSLPIPTSEVSVTRRVTRSGESEYSINRQSCRQRDVYDLLADSGLGRSGYAIVSQKEIDQALAASPEERRAWLDEAAGVQRYRARKVEAIKRLAAAQSHLQRVHDVMRELESQREPLREEAEAARRYKTALNALREVEVGLLVRDLAKANREIAELAAKIEEAQKLAEQETRRAEKAEQESLKTAQKAGELEKEIEGLWAAHQRAMTTKERAEAELRLSEQRLQSVDEMERSLGDEAGLIEKRLAEARAEIAVLEAEDKRERAALEQIEVECAGAGEETAQLAKKLDEVERELSRARELHVRRMRQEAEEAHRNERMSLLKRELAGIAKTLPDLEKAFAEADSTVKAQAGAMQRLEGEAQELDARLLELRQKEEKDAEATRAWLAERAALDGRRLGIESTITSHESLHQGAKAVMDAAAEGTLKGSFRPLGEAIETDREHALAVETALGSAVDDLVVKDADVAKRAIRWLKENSAGRATFLVLSELRETQPPRIAKDLLEDPAAVGRASDLARCEEFLRPVVDKLLGEVLLVKSLDDALRLAPAAGSLSIVTLDGEMVRGGAVSGGRSATGGYGVVQRKAELAKIVTEIKQLGKQIAEAETRAAKRGEERKTAEARLSELRAKIRELAGDLDEARSYARELHDELHSTARSRTRAQHELDELSKVAVEKIVEVDTAAIEGRRDQVLRALAAKSADAEGAEQRLREAQSRVQQAEIRLAGGLRRVSSAEEAELHRMRRLTNLEPERKRLHAEIEAHVKQRDEAEADAKRTEGKLNDLKSQKHALSDEAAHLAEEARNCRANAVAVVDGVHSSELSRARAESRRASALERLMEEYGINQEEAIAQEGLHEVPSDATSVVQRLRRELRAMGDVNLGAVEAYERLTERFDELQRQDADIRAGIDQVNESMAELDELTRERFQSTFDAVQIAFAELFQKLFGGGDGRLLLTNPESLLESGIEIEVTLPGKKRQRLELLSGGERALCACAFLFALLKVKPSPLVVLDEVDAPLDGRNVERFVALLHEFAEQMQFIIVTHNRVTIEGSPVWLGVTMQEPGVSTLIPTRVPMDRFERPALAVVEGDRAVAGR